MTHVVLCCYFIYPRTSAVRPSEIDRTNSKIYGLNADLIALAHFLFSLVILSAPTTFLFYGSIAIIHTSRAVH